MFLTTHRVDKDNIRVVDVPQHLLNASFRTSSSVHDWVEHCYRENYVLTFSRVIVFGRYKRSCVICRENVITHKYVHTLMFICPCCSVFEILPHDHLKVIDIYYLIQSQCVWRLIASHSRSMINQCKKTSQFITQCKSDIRHAFKTAKTRKRGNCECIATWGSPTPLSPSPL